MLKKEKLKGYPLPVATVGQATRDSAEAGGANPAIALKDDVWLEGGVFVVDFGAEKPCDILEVALNLSYVERTFGKASADALAQTKRLTASAFGLIGATAVHRIVKDQSNAALGLKPTKAALQQQQDQQAMLEDVLRNLDLQPKVSSSAYLRLVWLVVLVACVAAIAFRRTAEGGSKVEL